MRARYLLLSFSLLCTSCGSIAVDRRPRLESPLTAPKAPPPGRTVPSETAREPEDPLSETRVEPAVAEAPRARTGELDGAVARVLPAGPAPETTPVTSETEIARLPRPETVEIDPLEQLEASALELWGELVPPPEPSPERRRGEDTRGGYREVAEHLLLLSLWRNASPVNDATREAVEVLRNAPDAGLDAQLLAAAFLHRAGLARERDEALLEICRRIAVPSGEMEEPPAPEPETTGGERPLPLVEFADDLRLVRKFGLRNVTFASKIFGPGRYEGLPEFRFPPGGDLLVYGEFRDYAETPVGDTQAPRYARRFSATMRLVDPQRRILDTCRVLAPTTDISKDGTPRELVNFWFQYRLPKSLPEGPYSLIIHGKDLVGGAEASAVLGFEVRSPQTGRP